MPLRRALVALLLLVPLAAPAEAAPRRAGEYDLKAAFLFNFTHFVEWPPESFARADSPLLLCLVGEDPFGGVLDELLRGESAGGHPIVLQRFDRAAEADACHLLFMPRSHDSGDLRRVPGVREGTVLTVGEGERFLADGGLVRFVLEGGRVRLQVSSTALSSSKLRISSKLLRLTESVTPGPRR